jgi:hypothetical protein
MITKFRVGNVVRLALKDHEGLPKGTTGIITKIIDLSNSNYATRKTIRILLNIIDGKGFRKTGDIWYVDEDILEFNTPIISIKTSKELR